MKRILFCNFVDKSLDITVLPDEEDDESKLVKNPIEEDTSDDENQTVTLGMLYKSVLNVGTLNMFII